MDQESRVEEALINNAIDKYNAESMNIKAFTSDNDEELEMLNYKHLEEYTKDYLIHYIIELENTIKKTISYMDKASISNRFSKNENILSTNSSEAKKKSVNMENNHIREIDIL